MSPDDDLLYLRSLRTSRSRRASSARKRHGRLRRRSAVALALTTLAFASTGAVAAEAPTTRSSTVAAVQQKLGVAADGVYGPITRRAVKRFQRRSGLVVDGVVGPATLRALGIQARAASTGNAALLARIAECESGGDPTAVSPSGQYRGKYQFSRATWRSLGGTGDPAAASEGEQDLRAAALLERQGRSAWPNCA